MENYNEIQKLLMESTCSHLAERCFHEIPEANLIAISKMIQAHKESFTQRAMYRYQVVQDVVALIEGNISNPLFSQQFLTDTPIDTPACEKCGCSNKVINKVSIPDSDIQYMCGDCMFTLPLSGVVDYKVEH